MRDAIERTLCEAVACARIIGGQCDRLPNTSMIAFEGCTSEKILIGLSERGICASGGSACHSGALEPSRALLAMGVSRESAVSAVRFSFSRYTSRQEIDQLLAVLPEVLETRNWKRESRSRASSF